MKTPVDLSDRPVIEAKLRAGLQELALRDLAADFVRQGQKPAAPRTPQARPRGSMVQSTPAGLPVVRCRADASSPGLTLNYLSALEQQSQTCEDMHQAFATCRMITRDAVVEVKNKI